MPEIIEETKVEDTFNGTTKTQIKLKDDNAKEKKESDETGTTKPNPKGNITKPQKTKLIGIFIFILALFIGGFVYVRDILTTDPSKTESSIPQLIWSEEQGRMNWIHANKKCKSMGMRLPTINEFQTAKKSGLTDGWLYDRYWTNEIARNNMMYIYDKIDSTGYGESKDKMEVMVRCVK